MLLVIDLSSNNPLPYDLEAAQAAGITGVIVKLSQGASYVNPFFAETWALAGRLGMWRGIYHFATPGTNTPEAEAAFFLANLPALAPGDALALDIEVGIGDLSGWALAWLGQVADAVGFAPLLYSYADFIEHHLMHPALAAYNLWLAEYTSRVPATLGPWPFVALWQYTAVGQVAGISGHVDMSQIARDRPGLNALGKPAHPLRRIVTACALKPLPGNHTTPALAMIPAGSVVADYGPTGGGWEQVAYQSRHGAVLATNLKGV